MYVHIDQQFKYLADSLCERLLLWANESQNFLELEHTLRCLLCFYC